MKDVAGALPAYSYMYLGDNARTPYGGLSQEVIYRFTLQGVKFLFERGAELVILACNTASSGALRRIQQDFLPHTHPERRVLGVIIPTAEEASTTTQNGEIGVLATEATVESGVYEREFRKINPRLNVYSQACPLLVPLIEAGEFERGDLDSIIRRYVEGVLAQSEHIDTLVLGCTHYSLIAERIGRLVPGAVTVFSQGSVISRKLKEYLGRHPEIEARLARDGRRQFFTTGDAARVRHVSELFYDEPISFGVVRFG